jgi:hypothetical protein
MANFGTVGAVVVVKDVGSGAGNVKHTKFTMVGDAAYVTGGSVGFLKALQTACGDHRQILHLQGSGHVLDSTTAEHLEYTPRGAALDATVVASSDLFTAAGSAFAAGDAVRFFKKNHPNAGAGGAIKSLNNPDPVLPGGVTEDTIYYVIASGLTATAFKVSTSSGGSTIDVTDAGLGDFVVVKEDLLLVRQDSDGVESADGDQSDMTYNGYAVTY